MSYDWQGAQKMETASLAIAPDPAGLDQLLIDIRNKPMEPRAVQQQAVLAFGRRTNAQPPLAVLLQDAVALVGEVLDAPLGGVGEVRGDTLVLTVAARDAEGRGAAPQEHRCCVSDVNSMAAFALQIGQRDGRRRPPQGNPLPRRLPPQPQRRRGPCRSLCT